MAELRSTSLSSGRANYRVDLQVLRAICILAVFGFHLWPSIVQGGYLGVDVFFVISGFLITRLIYKGIETENLSFLKFMTRRCNRLLPALMVMLLVVLILGVIALPPAEFEGLFTHLPWACLQVSNFSFMEVPDYFGAEHSRNPVLHTWSLGIEEQFYILWAPFLLIFSKLFPRRLQRVLLIGCLGMLVISILGNILVNSKFGKDIAFFSPLHRAWQLAIGSLAAYFVPEDKCKGKKGNLFALAGFLLIIASVFVFKPGSGLNAVPCLATCLILVFPFSLPTKSWVLLVKPLEYIGDISYSLYLWHWPVICFYPFVTNNLELGLVDYPIIIVVSFALASLSFHFVESTTRGRSSIAKPLGFIGGLLALYGGSIALETEETASWRFAAVEPSKTLGVAKTMRGLKWAKNQPIQPERLKFSESTNAQAILLGDSHAEHYYPAVEQWCANNQKALTTFYAGAFLSIGRDTKLNRYKTDGRIITFDNTAYSRYLFESLVENSHIDSVFIAHRTAWYVSESLPFEQRGDIKSELTSDKYQGLNSQELFALEMESFVSGLIESEKKVILLGQIRPLRGKPKQGPTLIESWFHGQIIESNLMLAPLYNDRFSFEDQLFRKLAENSAVHYFKAIDKFPVYRDSNGASYYEDDNHLNGYGGLFLGQFFDF